ncbi:MAG TPA: SH3 domain-containing protein [Anaerolineales bacterium]|nr:SH3 domain-containing protein [Anaerolineales bacterium]
MIRSIAPNYDLFKLIVTIILLALLLFLGLRSCTPSQAPVASTPNAGVSLSAAASPTKTPTPSTSAPATVTVTSTIPSTPTLLPVSSPTSTSLSTPTIPAPAASPTQAQVAATDCQTILPSQLRVDNAARVMRNLNMREAPQITGRLLTTNRTGTQVQIIDGPVCTPQGSTAYLWWMIRLSTGSEGWSAEMPLHERTYFLEPIP